MYAWIEEAPESVPWGSKSVKNWQAVTAGFNPLL